MNLACAIVSLKKKKSTKMFSEQNENFLKKKNLREQERIELN
jgi:hypothetical protein